MKKEDLTKLKQAFLGLVVDDVENIQEIPVEFFSDIAYVKEIIQASKKYCENVINKNKDTDPSILYMTTSYATKMTKSIVTEKLKQCGYSWTIKKPEGIDGVKAQVDEHFKAIEKQILSGHFEEPKMDR